ncbi:golgin subfamily A member 1-like protein [Leptotrombidium deliense]|uniref:Golgin subfamily A member 1-like protein n=1 Tax=Leptotrombidium deliense TaxID=299467 RepID=A0A443S9X6_9ACAR|nr:golgin subfamily A member 1-like protein [Leptotrombidium deliense]
MKDMKKSLENGDLLPFRKKGADIHSANSNSDLYDSSSTDNSPRLPRKVKVAAESNNLKSLPPNATVFNEISFQYLKNLVYKFVTSSECEAQQLIKALSVLLKFSAEEEQSIKEILDWRMSWYKNLPIVGNGLKPAAINK